MLTDYSMKKLENGDNALVDNEGNVICIVENVERFAEDCKEVNRLLSHYEMLLKAFHKLSPAVHKAMEEATEHVLKLETSKLDDVNNMRVAFIKAALGDIFMAFVEMIPVANKIATDRKENK